MKTIFYSIPSGIALLVSWYCILLYPDLPGFAHANAYFYQLRRAYFDSEFEALHTVVLGIDRESIDLVGHWPWDRQAWGAIISRLSDAHPKAIAMDIVFNMTVNDLPHPLVMHKVYPHLKLDSFYAPARYFSSRLDDHFSRIAQQLSGDKERLFEFLRERDSFLNLYNQLDENAAERVFIQALTQNDSIILAAFLSDAFFENSSSQEETKEQFNPVALSGPLEIAFPDIPDTPFATLNLRSNVGEHLQQGVANIDSDAYGFFTTFRHVYRIDDLFAPSIALLAVSRFAEEPIVFQPSSTDGGGRISIGAYHVDLDRYGKTDVHVSSKPIPIPTYSVKDLLEGKIHPSKLEGKCIVFGMIHPFFSDKIKTLYHENLPGEYLIASAIENILSGNTSQVVHRNTLLVRSIACGWVTLICMATFFASRKGLRWGILGLLLTLIVAIGSDIFVFNRIGIFTPIAWYPFSGGLVLFFMAADNYIAHKREERRLKNTLGKYVSRLVMEEILSSQDEVSLSGKTFAITVLFSDIRGFTTLSEKMHPEDISKLLNLYLTPMTEAILSHEGTLDKYIGDAIMAFFGAPLASENHAEMACHAALEMQRRLSRVNQELSAKGFPTIEMGIGINSGNAIVGNMGSEDLFDYTALGDTVNLASRIESLNKVYGTTILAGEATVDALDENWVLKKIDRVTVKGKTESIYVYEVLTQD